MQNVNLAGCAPWLIVCVLCLGACTRDAPQEPATAGAAGELAGAAAATDEAVLAWAGEALARNPALEVVATDNKAGIFTVRMRMGGELRTIRMDELVAAPPSGTAATIESDDTLAMADEDPDMPAPAAAQAIAPQITVTREAGRLSISGPGVSIASAGAPAATVAAGTGAEEDTRSAQRRNQPIVCQGSRLMRIDGRVIDFEGDGIIVEDGCDLHLTNSRISAGGTAITVTGGKVHIVNSIVKGTRGSIEASQGSQVFMSGASIDGLQRRFDTAQINDLGDNRYR